MFKTAVEYKIYCLIFNFFFMSFWSGVGSALVSGVGNVLGGLLGSNSQKKANETNLQAVRETNSANRSMVASTNLMNQQLAREQMEWNTKMWHQQNEYNSPANQMARYQAAGLNPNLMYGSINSGNASSVPTYQRAQAVAPRAEFGKVEPVTALADRISRLGDDMINTYYYTKSAQADNAVKIANADYIQAKADTERERKNYWIYSSLEKMFGAKKAEALAPYFAQDALNRSTILSNQAINSSLQNDLARDLLTDRKFGREIRSLEYDLKKSRLSFDEKRSLRDHLERVRQFNATFKQRGQMFNSNAQRWRYDHNLRIEEADLRRDEYNWTRRKYLYDIPLEFLKRIKLPFKF